MAVACFLITVRPLRFESEWEHRHPQTATAAIHHLDRRNLGKIVAAVVEASGLVADRRYNVFPDPANRLHQQLHSRSLGVESAQERLALVDLFAHSAEVRTARGQ
jgi:hypothetical protein